MAENDDRMLELALGLPGQLLTGFSLAAGAQLGRTARPANVVIAGMGGSGIGGKLLAGLLLDESRVPVLLCQDYDVPAVATRQSLFIAVSHSGDTEETLSAFSAARKRGCSIVAITGGGRLARLASGHGCPVVTLPMGMPPRAALGYLFGALLVTLERLGVCSSHELDRHEAVSLMLARSGAWQRQSRTIARALDGRLPVVYSTSRPLDAVALRWQSQLNENAKVMCHTHVLPEQNHNEIVGLGGPEFLRKSTVLLPLVDAGTHPRTRLRLQYMLRLAHGAFERAIVLEAEGRSRLARIFSLVMLGDLVSIELARLRGEDPMAIVRIDGLKRLMAKAAK